MSEHIDHDNLLSYQLNLLEPAQIRKIEAHLESCERCRSELEEVSMMLEEATAGPSRPHEIAHPPTFRRFFESTWTPVLVMAVSLILSGIPGWYSKLAATPIVPLLLGAIFVATWIHVIVSRVELDWYSVGKRGWGSAPVDEMKRLMIAEGIKLSTLRSLTEARVKIAHILTLSLTLFIFSAGATFAAWCWIPEIASTVASSRPDILPGALALGVVLGGVILASWRLVRIARSVADFLSATNELSSLNS